MSLSKMSLSITTEQWTLKDKKGNPPPNNIVSFSQKIPKRLLFPCPRTADELEMPERGDAPREMNSFMVFRRQLAYVAKKQKTSDDGRVISSAASFMWNGANNSDRESYTQIAGELKRRHRLKYPNYTYERRKRKTAEEDFIVYDGAMVQSKNKKKQKKSHNAPRVNSVSKEPECDPISFSLQGLSDEWFFNPFASQVPQISQVENNFCYNECCNGPLISEEVIPVAFQTFTGLNYLNWSPQQQLQIQNNLSQQSIHTTFNDDYSSFYNGIDTGISSSSSFVELEKPIDEIIYNSYEV